MRRIAEYPLWIGNARDARDVRSLLNLGIEAIVDLAVDEPPVAVTRELLYLRFPLVDGGGNPSWMLQAAVRGTEPLIRLGVPTLVACGGGMSRSLAIAAKSLFLSGKASGQTADETLSSVRSGGPSDVHPVLWQAVKELELTQLTIAYEPRD